MKNLTGLLVALLLLTAAYSSTKAEPRKIGSIYESPLTVFVDDGSGGTQEKESKATLEVIFADKPDEKPSITLQLDSSAKMSGYRLSPSMLPEEYRGLMPEGQSMVITVPGYLSNSALQQLRVPLFSVEMPKQTWVTKTFLDAYGNPMADLSVAAEMYSTNYDGDGRPGTPFAKGVTGEDGTFSFPAPVMMQYGTFGKPNSSQHFEFTPQRYRVVVIEPVLGQRLYVSPDFHDQWCLDEKNPDTCFLPFVNADQVDGDDIFRGAVRNPDGKGIGGACFAINQIRFSEQYDTLSGNLNFRVYTGSEGRCALRIPRFLLVNYTRQDSVPPSAWLSGMMTPPSKWEENLSRTHARLALGQENIIVLPRAADIAMGVLDESGLPVADTFTPGSFPHAMLERKSDRPGMEGHFGFGEVSVKRISEDGKGSLRLLASGVELPGTYRLTWRERKYEAQELTWDNAASTIVWRPVGGQTVFTGKVVDGPTGAPIEGAYVVMGANSSQACSWQQMKNHEWDTIFEGVEPGQSIVPANREPIDLGDRYRWGWNDILAIGRTGADGTYRLTAEEGKKATTISIFMPGYLALDGRLDFISLDMRIPDELKEYEWPVAPLYPAATVTMTILPPDGLSDEAKEEFAAERAKGYWPNPSFDFEPPASWVQIPILPKPGFHVPEWTLEPNCEPGVFGEPFERVVPAEAAFTLGGGSSSTGNSRYIRPSWKVDTPIPRGANVALEAKAYTLAMPILMLARLHDGSPAANVTINFDSGSVITDETGSAMAYLAAPHIAHIVVLNRDSRAGYRMHNIDIPDSAEPFQLNVNLPEDFRW